LGLWTCPPMGAFGSGGEMLREVATQESQEAVESKARIAQFEMLRDYILDEYYRMDQIEGWRSSEMERPDRKTVLRLIRFFLNEI